jgi:hypothetical protein
MAIKKIIIIFILILPLITSIEIEMKSSFNKGETLISKISGNFIKPPTLENINLYKGHTQIPLSFNLKKFDNDYYICASLLEKEPDNYSIKIKNIRYYSGGEIIEEDISKNFTINPSIAIFSIIPGIISTDSSFYLKVQNLLNYEINLNIENNENISTNNPIKIKSGENKKIDFEINKLNQSSLNKIILSSEGYEYPLLVYIYKSEEIISNITGNSTIINDSEENSTIINDSEENSTIINGSEENSTIINDSEEKINTIFGFNPSKINLSIPAEENFKIKGIIYLRYNGEEILENITFSISDSLKNYISIYPSLIKKIEKNQIKKITIEISSEKREKIIKGLIEAKSSSKNKTSLKINLNITKDLISLEDYISNSSNYSSINTLNFSSDNFNYSSYSNSTKTKKEKEFSTGKFIGFGLIILIIAYLIWFFKKKYPSTKKEIKI